MGYRADPMCSEDRQALFEIWSQNMSDPGIAEVTAPRFRWLYEQNPAGTATTWLGVERESDTIIGCGSFVPRRILVDGELLTAGMLA